jgi:hypothetical protein
MNREKLGQELFQRTQFGERLTPKGKRWLGWLLLASSVFFRLVFGSPLGIFGIVASCCGSAIDQKPNVEIAFEVARYPFRGLH